MHSPTTTNALYYHSHITHNITHVDQRTHKYIKYRKEFLKQYCSPLEDRITQLDKEIQYYKHLIENQNEMIENQNEVARLKTQIGEFTQSQKYFLSRIDEYQKRILELNVENDVIEQQIAKLKAGLCQLTLIKSHQVYNDLHSFNDAKSISSSKHSRSMIKSSAASKTLMHSRIKGDDQKYGEFLPPILKVDKYYGSKKGTENENSMVGEEGGDNQQRKRQDKIANKKTNSGPQSRASFQKKHIQLKNKFKQHITTFNKFEILFKECFQKKKSQVQKSVSQLQSKLISDRQKFLQICQAISQRDLKKNGFHHFETLTGDQLMTLFISFPWIQKKIFKDLNQRSKLIVQLQKTKFL